MSKPEQYAPSEIRLRLFISCNAQEKFKEPEPVTSKLMKMHQFSSECYLGFFSSSVSSLSTSSFVAFLNSLIPLPNP